jgi:hypothetical protein
VVVHSCNPSTQEAKAGELQVKDQNGLQSETLSQENPKITTKTLEKVLRIHFFFECVCVCVVLGFEPLHQPFYVMGYFKIGSQELFAQGWL